MANARIAALEQMLVTDPTDTTAHYMLGLEYFKAQMYAEAVATLPRPHSRRNRSWRS